MYVSCASDALNHGHGQGKTGSEFSQPVSNPVHTVFALSACSCQTHCLAFHSWVNGFYLSSSISTQALPWASSFCGVNPTCWCHPESAPEVPPQGCCVTHYPISQGSWDPQPRAQNSRELSWAQSSLGTVDILRTTSSWAMCQALKHT